MKILVSALAALSLAALADATPRPQLLLPSQEIQLPADLHPWDVAIAGDWVAIGGTVYGDSNTPFVSERVYLYQRDSNGVWNNGTLLFDELSDQYAATLEMNDQILVVSSGVSTHIFEKTTGGWPERTMDAGVASVAFPAVALDGTTVLLAEGRCGARGVVLEPTSAAHWAQTGEMRGTAKECNENQYPLTVALSGDTAILWDWLARRDQKARVFERTSASTWINTQFLEPSPSGLESDFGTTLALRGSLALVGGTYRGSHVYRHSDSAWRRTGFLSNHDHFIQTAVGTRIGDRYIVYNSADSAVDAPVLRVFREDAQQGFEEVAQLTTPDRTPMNAGFDLSGSEIVGVAWDKAKIFFYQLPESPGVRGPLQYDFESGTTADWSIVPGGSFSVAQSGPTRVYRQASTAGDAGAMLSEDLTAQAIQADITPRAFDGTDRWFGLITRYTDESNYYYVTLRNSGRVSLRRKLNGVFTELAAAPVGVSLDKPLRIRLESTVDRQVVFIGDRQILSAVDNTLPHGRAGLRTYRAAADFDNVLVSAAPPAVYVAPPLPLEQGPFDAVDGDWSYTVTPQLEVLTYGQRSLAGDARSVAWPVSDDQIVQSWMRVDQFAAGNGDPWVGLVARYQDPANYYYVTLRRSNQVSLRRLVNGQITILGSVTLPVTPGIGRVVRLDVVGQKLRLYVDGAFAFEASDATFASGKAGLVTYRAAASFSDFSAYQP